MFEKKNEREREMRRIKVKSSSRRKDDNRVPKNQKKVELKQGKERYL